jgi:hypothetical protein
VVWTTREIALSPGLRVNYDVVATDGRAQQPGHSRRRDPRWHVSDVAMSPGDATCRELLEVHSAFYGKIADEAAFVAQMIEARRLVVRLAVKRLYGVLLDTLPGT